MGSSSLSILDLPHGHGGTICILSELKSVSIDILVLHVGHVNEYVLVIFSPLA